MLELSATIFRELTLCPKAFYYRRIEKLSLPLGTKIYNELEHQRVIDHLTEMFYSSLLELTKKKFHYNTRYELERLIDISIKNKLISTKNYDTLTTSIFSFLSWVTQDVWVTLSKKSRKDKRFIPILVNRTIHDPVSRLKAQPSMIFAFSDSNVMSVIQKYDPYITSFMQIPIETAICIQVLKSIGFNMTNILYINYFNMDITYKPISSSDYRLVRKLTDNLRSRIDKQEFEKNMSEYCQYCEFNLLCNN